MKPGIDGLTGTQHGYDIIRHGNNEVENTGYMLNELMKAKVNRLRLSVRSYINPTEQNKPLELEPWASDVTRDPS